LKILSKTIDKIKQTDPVLAAAIGLGLLFRLFLWKTIRLMIGFDEANYLRLAGHALETDLRAVFHPYWSPFYPFVVWCFSLVNHHLEAAGRWVNVLAGAGLIPLMYAWSRRLFGSVSARLTALMIALYPPLAFADTSVMPEALYSLAGISGMLLGWRALAKNRWGSGLAAGICWGAAYLSKPEGIGFLIVFLALSLIWRIIRRTMISWLKIGVIALAATTGFLCLSSPYLIYLKQSTGAWTISTKGMLNQQMEAAVVFNDGPVKDPFFHVTSDNRHLPYDMGMHFGNFHELKSLSESKERMVQLTVEQYFLKIARNLHQLIRECLPRLFGVGLLIFFTLGFFDSCYPSRKFLLLYLLTFVGSYWFGMVPLFHVNIRYLTPLLPIFFIWIGHGSRMVYQWLAQLSIRGRRISRPISAIVVGALYVGGVFLIEMAPVFNQRNPGAAMWAQPLELKKAALWLRSRTEKPPRLMTLNKAIDFYAGQYDMTQGASFSYDSIQKNLAYARHRGCEYVIFTSRYLSWFDNLKPLVGDSDPPGIQRIYDRTNDLGIRAVIYRIEDNE
jgi:4-amino-4-deoxy-L-arabinose transferase-like glycosyltransferase